MKLKRITLLIILAMTFNVIPVDAHSGRTDSSGGHRDNYNASGLGYYHYHHGMGPHLHPNGKCPYYTSSTNTSTTRTTAKKIQQALNDHGYYCGSVDGIIGLKTRTQIKEFQRDHGLTVDGIVGC